MHKLFCNFFLLAVLSFLHAGDFNTTGKTRWDFGIGIGALSLPHYRGSDQEATYIAPVPYIRYHGNRLRINREGARFYLYEGDFVHIDISTAFAIGVDSDDNEARLGMPDLGFIVEMGPRIQWNLYQSDDKNLRFRFALPLRTATATNFQSAENIGWVIAPYLQLRYFNDGWESAITLGPVWADNQYHDYFYEVLPQYATAERESYNASSGYSGSRIRTTFSKRFKRNFFGFFAKYDYLNHASFINSPLLRKKSALTIGMALSWVFK